MLPDFGKPVVLTGSQLPIGVVRTDGKENLLTAIEIAGTMGFDETRRRGPLVREVVVYFGDELYAGKPLSQAGRGGVPSLGQPQLSRPWQKWVCTSGFRRDLLLLRPRGEARLIGECDRGVTVVHSYAVHDSRGAGSINCASRACERPF